MRARPVAGRSVTPAYDAVSGLRTRQRPKSLESVRGFVYCPPPLRPHSCSAGVPTWLRSGSDYPITSNVTKNTLGS